jgi:hypothetical protein
MLFDKFKHSFMPYDQKKYKGIDYLWRVGFASALCMTASLAITYPFDLIHTRMSADMSKIG